jgi:Leucine-rich repeat (LRR) protein
MGSAASALLSSRSLLLDLLTALDGKTPVEVDESGTRVRTPNNGALEGWGGKAPVGEWCGVTVDDSGGGGSVVSIELAACNLLIRGDEQAAAVGSSLGRLSKLTAISLPRNYLTTINVPALGRLAVLDLSKNRIHQPLPEGLGRCRSLRTVNLSHNRFGSSTVTLYELVYLYVRCF